MTKDQLRTQYKIENKAAREAYKQAKTERKNAYRLSLSALLSEEATAYQTAQNQAMPQRSVLQEIGNAITHGIGSAFAVVAFLCMLFASNTPEKTLGAILYFIGLFVLFTMSCLYHSFRYGSAVKRLFRRFDYSSIYLLIGATFAPILLCQIGGQFGSVFFLIQWLIIAVGITFIGVFGPNKWKNLHMALYVLLGWSGLILLPSLIESNPYLFTYILLGCIIYTLGIIPFALKKGCAHFIWHFFVLGGAIVQWIGIYGHIYL